MELEKQLEQKFDAHGVKQNHRENITRLLSELREYHKDTYEHSIRVGIKASEIASYMRLNPKPALYGVLHDIGKTKIPLEVLSKTSGFNDDDMKIMKAHAIEGFNILLREGYMFSAAIASMHHRFQPHSYPEHLPGLPFPLNDRTKSSLSLYARIVSIADHNDALRRKNDKFSSGSMTGEKGKQIMIELNRDQESLINGLYSAGVLN